MYCQVDRGGVPRSFQFQQVLKSQLKTIEVASPDLLTLQKEDFEDSKLEKPYRVGVEVAVDISPVTDGQWEYEPLYVP